MKYQSMDLQGRSYIIVGGTSGMGLAVAVALEEKGASVMVVGKDEKSCEEAGQFLGKKDWILRGNATNSETIEKVISCAEKEMERIDGLFHVAGGSGRRYGDGPLHEMTDEGWKRTLELNLTSMMYSNRAIIQYFIRKDLPGTILNMGSVLATSPSPTFFTTHAYVAAKAAVIGLSQSLASCYAKNNIRVNVIAPALMDTPMAGRAMTDEKIQKFLKTKQPLDGGRPGRPEDIVEAALMFLSPASVFITGQVLNVDGGWTLSDGQVPK